MDTEIRFHDHPHLLGESATHPIEPRYGTLPALLRLAGRSPQRCHALPAHRITAHSGASNCRFQVYSWSSLTRLSSAELTITDKDDSAMAAAAIIGLRNPRAAIGTPMLL